MGGFERYLDDFCSRDFLKNSSENNRIILMRGTFLYEIYLFYEGISVSK